MVVERDVFAGPHDGFLLKLDQSLDPDQHSHQGSISDTTHPARPPFDLPHPSRLSIFIRHTVCLPAQPPDHGPYSDPQSTGENHPTTPFPGGPAARPSRINSPRSPTFSFLSNNSFLSTAASGETRAPSTTMHFLSILSTALLATCVSASLQIVPGATWTATNTGEHVQAHGAGIIKVGSTYYLIGEDKTNGTYFLNVNCYSSTNLVEWTYVGALLSQQSSGDLGPGRIVERPKVIYNDQTKKYVLWAHIDSSDYKDAKVGVATGDSVCGKYQYQGSWRPLGFQSRDMGLFKDDDGSAYLLTEDVSYFCFAFSLCSHDDDEQFPFLMLVGIILRIFWSFCSHRRRAFCRGLEQFSQREFGRSCGTVSCGGVLHLFRMLYISISKCCSAIFFLHMLCSEMASAVENTVPRHSSSLRPSCTPANILPQHGFKSSYQSVLHNIYPSNVPSHSARTASASTP